MITLYQRTDCPFCWKVRLALAELDLEYSVVEIALGETHPEFGRLSPIGTVPILVDEGVVIWESAVIIDYLDSRYAPGRLLSGDCVAQVNTRLLHAYSDKVVGASIRDLVFEKRSKPENEWDTQLIRLGMQKWSAVLVYLEEQLAQGPNFHKGFGASDCALAARFGVAEAYGVAVTAEYPGLHRWYGETRERPSWKMAYPQSFIRAE